jgi:glycyl-tRNA synthetase
MFETKMNGFSDSVFLRPETAGAIFVEFKNVLNSSRQKIPFGIAQIGKAFRNEIVAGNFIFRLREFEQMEIEYFFNPEDSWEEIFEYWIQQQEEFAGELGIKKKEIQRFEHPKDKLSHYSQKTVDIEYDYPFGFSELFGLAHRGDFDLSSHSKASGEKLEYQDPATGKRYIPHVIEPTFGLDRSFLACVASAYTEEKLDNEDKRVFLKLPYKIAPVKVAVFPLLKNKPKLVEKAGKVFEELKSEFVCEFDDNGNIGKRYRRQDEIGTPYCVTVDFDSLEDNSVTVRNRDTMEQERIAIADLRDFLGKNLQ